MPVAPLRPCAQPGCGERVAKGYCAEHGAAREATRARGRLSAAARGYDWTWHNRSRAFLRRYPLCGQRRPDARRTEPTDCQREGHATPANVVDHLFAHKGDQALFWDERNWCASCATCNRRKAVREEGRFGYGRG